MAGQDRMTIEEVVRQVLRDEHGDVIRESVSAVAQELMEGEISNLIGAQHYERTEDRATHRNGQSAAGDQRHASGAEGRDRQGPRLAVAALHRALPQRSPRPCSQGPARRTGRRDPLDLHRLRR